MPRPPQDPPDPITFVRPDTGEEVTLEIQPMSRWDRRPALVNPKTGAKTPLEPAKPVWMLWVAGWLLGTSLLLWLVQTFVK